MTPITPMQSLIAGREFRYWPIAAEHHTTEAETVGVLKQATAAAFDRVAAAVTTPHIYAKPAVSLGSTGNDTRTIRAQMWHKFIEHTVLYAAAAQAIGRGWKNAFLQRQ